jgi:broad specificity phosphatase PhoE
LRRGGTRLIEFVPHPRLLVDVVIGRHGQTQWNAESRIMGARPIPLNQAGRAEARAMASALPGFRPALCVTSPVRRAMETADLALAELGATPSRHEHDGLTEFRMGQWEGERLADLRPLAAWRAYLESPAEVRFPDGETLAEIQTRAVEAVNEMVAQTTGSILIVTHAGVVRLLALAALAAPLSSYHRTAVGTASVTQLRLVPGRPPQIRAMGAAPLGLELI